MSADKLENKFDEMLRKDLRKHTEPVPADFTERISRQIRELEEQKILARVILQERLALAGCIGVVVIAIVGAVVFPNIADSFTEQVMAFVNKTAKIIEAAIYDWQFYMVFVAVFGIAVYGLVDLLVGDG